MGAGMFIESITLHYLKDFRCVGALCSDSCCTGWGIALSDDDHRTLQRHLSTSAAGEALLRGNIVTTLDGEGREHHSIALRGDASCSFLTRDRWCSLQQRDGEPVLPRLCSRFPRIVSIVGQRLEISATLACPETARRCLLDPRAMTMVPMPEGMIADNIPHNFFINLHHGNPYIAQFDRVRAELFLLCRLNDYPLATKLFFISYFASRIGSFFNSGGHDDPSSALNHEFIHINRPGIRQEVHHQFSRIALSEKKCMELIAQVMDAGFSRAGTPSFRALLIRSLVGYGADADLHGVAIGIDRILANYQDAKRFWSAEFPRELDQYLTHYVVNHLMSNPYIKEANLLSYIRELLVFVAVFKFILFGLLAGERNVMEKNREEKTSILEQHAVHAMQQFSKSIGHNPKLLDHVRSKIEAQGMNSLPHMVFLIQF
ncbi:MAG: flagellin lysine-N-methylase [Magnetococcales bacterium]|nr:flagellin lysine-N-methylase [Magnetococcales bacterium]MBF0149816.1 flagellin lysine-N-methylase [Magnetococcales bacterium]